MSRVTTPMDDRIPFACFVEEAADGLSVSICGEFDLAAVEDFDRTADEILAEGSPSIVVDLEGLSFLDSSGLLALLRLVRDAEALQRPVTFVRPSSAARRVLDLSGAARRLRLRP